MKLSSKLRFMGYNHKGNWNRSCVNCLKGVVTFLNFICWLCRAFMVGFGEFQMMHSRFVSLITFLCPINPANTLVVMETIVTCVCYLGIMGPLKENRWMLITVSLHRYTMHKILGAVGVHGVADWEGNVPLSCCTRDSCNIILQPNWQEGCHMKLRNWFARNFLSTRAGVVSLCILHLICLCFTVPSF
ncbi:hypothetical protein J4Q44_G00230740 [Coregonus suidteri]|uniref:Uncharacterized protein n=1 Tax=Coregonus suidteri TaxID=861788 RepID=A0AAN8LBV1_9TELE